MFKNELSDNIYLFLIFQYPTGISENGIQEIASIESN